MKDPKVTELVKQFEKDVATLNATWAKLQSNDVYVRMDIKGNSTYTEPKYLLVTDIVQSVKYMKETA